MMNWQVFGRKLSWFKYKVLSGIRLEGLRKATTNFSQDSWSSDRDLIHGPPEYEAGVSTTRPRRVTDKQIYILTNVHDIVKR
jgi:hypothetical protein